MNNLQETAERIKKITKQRNLQLTKMLLDLKLGKNTISKMSKGTDVVTQTIAKIADYLDCSVDFLIGRTENPQSHKLKAENNVGGNYNAVGNSNRVTVSTPSLDEHKKLLLDLYNKLSPIEQVELLTNLNKRTSRNENDNGVEKIYKVARTASGAEESPGGMVFISKEKLDLLESAPESDIE